jgi:oxygen-dependent protoporphyrinogen oxidase
MVLTVPTRILPFALSGLFSPWGKVRMGLEVLIPPRRSEREESIASFIKRRLGHEALERLAEPLLAGIHSGDPELLSMDQLFPRFVALEQKHGSLIRGMRKMRPRGDSSSSRTVFMSLAGGLSELVETLAAKLPKNAVRCETEVIEIGRDGSNYRVQTSTGECHTTDGLVLSLPMRATGQLSRGLSSDFTPVFSKLRAVSTSIVFLAFRREEVRHPLDGYGFVVPVTEGLRIQAGTFVSTKFPNRSPGSHVLLRGFFGGGRDQTAMDLSDRELVDLALKELSEILGPLPAPALERVYRWSEATPQVEVGHKESLTVIEGILNRFPGLEIAGNGIRGVGIPDCIADGRRAAESVLRHLEGHPTP